MDKVFLSAWARLELRLWLVSMCFTFMRTQRRNNQVLEVAFGSKVRESICTVVQCISRMAVDVPPLNGQLRHQLHLTPGLFCLVRRHEVCFGFPVFCNNVLKYSESYLNTTVPTKLTSHLKTQVRANNSAV